MEKKNIETFYEMCHRELEETKSNLAKYNKLIDEINGSVSNTSNLLEYDKALTDLTELSGILRKLNVGFKTLQLDTSKYVNAKQNSNKNTEERFSFTKPDLQNFKIGYKSCCSITYIKNKSERLFYINDVNNEEYLNCLHCLKENLVNSLLTLDHHPREGEVFGLIIDNFLYRAVRENDQHVVDTKNLYNVYLIDFGEVTSVKYDVKLYALTEQCARLTSQAVLCKLVAVDSNFDLHFEEYPYQLYEEKNFVVVNSVDSVLHLKFITNENHPDKCLELEKYPINNMKENTLQLNFNQSITSQEKKDNVPNSTETPFNNPVLFSCNQNSLNKKDVRISVGKDLTLSERDLAILNEEPLNTSSALEAVLGYVPKDEQRFCKFYNSNTQSCFKGVRCKFEHARILPDGWTRDEAEVFISDLSKVIYPVTGRDVNLFVTHVISIEYFYAHYYDNRSQVEDLKNLFYRMNTPEIQKKYEPMDGFPVERQLVIAQYMNKWYRAQIIEVISKKIIKVFYVDIGEVDIIDIEKARKWKSDFENLPYQTIKCRIAGIKRKNGLPEPRNRLTQMIESRFLRANTIEIDHDILVVKLIDERGCDIGEQLIEMGYALPSSINSAIPISEYLPG